MDNKSIEENLKTLFSPEFINLQQSRKEFLICYKVTQGNTECVYVTVCYVAAKSEEEAKRFAKKRFGIRWQTKGSICTPLFLSYETKLKLLGIYHNPIK